ncbi:RNA 2',3'-cyclic phosphodiesterase [Bacillus salitolerans]|uniref:RNA 2',3'-cyclic phosphodiesterase n=1 Tax=Bacillus salitolerans TaxID=1437434 RepID=A0ABW4LVY8_9BACI
MNTKTHFFLAIPISNELKAVYSKWQQSMKNQLPFKSWVHPEDYHITLAFLGDIPKSMLRNISKEMEVIAGKHHSFQLSLNGIGTFGRKESPRIFWAGLEREQKLFDLQMDVYRACKKLGFTLDDRPYNPHMTLARKWSSDDVFPNNLSHIVKGEEKIVSFSVKDFILYQTHLDRTPKYEPLSIFSLKD